MRIAIVTNFLAPYTVRLLVELQRQLPATDQLRVFLSTEMEHDRDWEADWDELEVVVQHSITFQSRARHPHGFATRSFTHVPLDTLSLLYRYQPDVLVSGEMGARSLQAVAYKSLHKDVRLLIWATLSESSELGRPSWRDQIRAFILSRADGVIVNGRSGARYVVRLGVHPDLIYTVPYSVALHPLPPAPSDAEIRRRLLFVGQLVGRKGLAEFFVSLRCFSGDTYHLTVVGDGPERKSLEAQAEQLGLNVTFMGSANSADLPGHYSKADALVFPTLADEWGVVVNEALTAGVPVLGSAYSQAVDELIVHGVNGWRFRPDRPEEVELAIQGCLHLDPVKLWHMRTAAMRSATAVSPPKVAELMLAAIAPFAKPGI